MTDGSGDDARAETALWVRAGGARFPVLRMTARGFAVDAAEVAVLPGAVDLFAGARHLATCLIVVSGEEDGERHYEFKRRTPVALAAAPDFDPAGAGQAATEGRRRRW